MLNDTAKEKITHQSKSPYWVDRKPMIRFAQRAGEILNKDRWHMNDGARPLYV